MIDKSLVNKVLVNPTSVKGFTEADWDLCIRQTRAANLMARVYGLICQHELEPYLPVRVKNHFNSALVKTKRQQQQVHFEVDQLAQLLADTHIPTIILKGAAYVMVNNAASLGRTSTDIDILVPKEKLSQIESILCAELWSRIDMDDYNQDYYRQWMHEIPPLIHLERNTVLDIHHNILPLTATTPVDAEKLLASKESLASGRNQYVLSKVDMLLHSATHLFHEGEFDKGLRDLTDLDLLFRQFSSEDEHFYQRLFSRAQEIGLTTPVCLAIRYCFLILKTPFSKNALALAAKHHPSVVKLKVLDFCFTNIFVPFHKSCDSWRFKLAALLLYLRGHLLRMPIKLLIPHLVKKSLMRFTGKAH